MDIDSHRRRVQTLKLLEAEEAIPLVRQEIDRLLELKAKAEIQHKEFYWDDECLLDFLYLIPGSFKGLYHLLNRLPYPKDVFYLEAGPEFWPYHLHSSFFAHKGNVNSSLSHLVPWHGKTIDEFGQPSYFNGFVLGELGWHLDDRQDWVSTCYGQSVSLVADQPKDDIDQDEIVTGYLDDQRCGCCIEKLLVLIDIQLNDPKLAFLKIGQGRIKIAYCMTCSCYGWQYTKFNFSGQCWWYKADPTNSPCYRHEDHIVEEGDRYLTVGSSNRSLLEGFQSKIGGIPSWVQNETFAICPDCQAKMLFLGQIRNLDVWSSFDGITCIFICVQCQVATTDFQQT